MDSRRSGSPRVDRYRDRDKTRPSPYARKDVVFGSKPGGKQSPPYNRIFVSNIPYEEKWQGIKDLFREQVGEVTYVELITDDNGNSKGFGIIEFSTKELVEKAVEKMTRFEIKDRKLVVKEDPFGEYLQKAIHRQQGMRGGGGPSSRNGMLSMPPPMPMPGMPPPMPRHGPLPPPMHQEIGRQHEPPVTNIEEKINEITGGIPLGDTVFIANLDYTVSYSKLKEVFSLAGKVVKVDLRLDHDNKSRGMATVTYETPLEALQAISMFNKQLLYDRPMIVKMDKNAGQPEKASLPSGLQGIGPALNLNTLNRGDNREALPMPRLEQPVKNEVAAELEMLNARRKLLESQLGVSVGGVSDVPRTPLSAGNLPSIPGLKPPSASDPLGLNLAVLKQSAVSSTPLSSLGLAQAAALGTLGGGGRNSETSNFGSQLNNYRGSLSDAGNSMGSPGISVLRLSDRDRIDMDIARVDSRIRDLDRSLKSAENRISSSHTFRAATPSTCTVFVANVPFSLSWQDLKQRLSSVGKVTYVNLKMENGKSKGYGHVCFESPEEAMMAVRHFNGSMIEGRKIEVRLDEDRRR